MPVRTPASPKLNGRVCPQRTDGHPFSLQLVSDHGRRARQLPCKRARKRVAYVSDRVRREISSGCRSSFGWSTGACAFLDVG